MYTYWISKRIPMDYYVPIFLSFYYYDNWIYVLKIRLRKLNNIIIGNEEWWNISSGKSKIEYYSFNYEWSSKRKNLVHERSRFSHISKNRICCFNEYNEYMLKLSKKLHNTFYRESECCQCFAYDFRWIGAKKWFCFCRMIWWIVF